MMKTLLLGVGALLALHDSAHAASCSFTGFALKHGNYTSNLGPCTLNADNYYNHYLDESTYPATSHDTGYPNIVADFAGTGDNGNLKKLTMNRVGGGTFYNGEDPTTFPENETESWSSVALYNPEYSNGKLLVFFPGSPVRPKTYIDFGLRAANAGYHVILLSEIPYGATRCVTDWGPSAGWSDGKGAPAPSEDSCITQIVDHITEGTTMSTSYFFYWLTEVGLTLPDDSANNRLRLMLNWLKTSFPTQGWSSFLDQGNVKWGITAVAGHSMGTQYVAHFATTHLVERAIFLAGPHPRLGDDSGGGWLGTPSYISLGSATPASRMYALLSMDDPNYADQMSNHLNGTLISSGSGYAGSTLVDWGMPFNDHSRLIIGTDVNPSCGGHSWVAGTCGAGEYQSSWDWMLTH